MNLCDDLPYSVEIGGKQYKLTPAFDNVLQMFAQTDDPALTDTEKAELMIYYLADNAPITAEALTAIFNALFTVQPKEASGPKAFDFVQDADLIFAGFYQAYGLDLIEEQGKLHWWKFSALLQGLPENTRFREVVNLRMRPLPEPTKYNSKERAALIKAKQAVALKITAEEREAELQNSLRRMAAVMLQQAKEDNE